MKLKIICYYYVESQVQDQGHETLCHMLGKLGRLSIILDSVFK